LSEENPDNFNSIDDWRNWLEENHMIKKNVWIVLQKKGSKKPGIRYEEAVLEAVAYGWIDGKMKRLNDDEFKQRFTPRRNKSNWSMSNRKRAEKLIVEGRMTPAGLRSVEEAKLSGRWDKAYSTKQVVETPKDLITALSENRAAYDNFNAFPRYAKYMYIHWINEAKRSNTRQRRIDTVVNRAEKNLKPGIDLKVTKSPSK
jgi:uncharacterized protein YdeI (YjbR/CyaY-like superfamily)